MEPDDITVQIAPSGDLRLLVDCESGCEDSETRIYVVSSTVLCLASPVWKAIFDPQGHFLEAKASTGSWEVHFAEDDPEALLVVLQIAHLQFQHLPETMNYQQLLSLAKICDKYDVVKLVRPWLSKWKEETKALVIWFGFEQWLFIAWAFGDIKTYKTLADLLVFEVTCDDAGRCFRSGKLLGNDLPPGSLGIIRILDRDESELIDGGQTETILKSRTVMITALLDMCKDLIERYYSDEHLCEGSRHGLDRLQCDNLNLGCLVKAMNQHKVWPYDLTASKVHQNLRDFIQTLRSLSSRAFEDRHSIHDVCKFSTKIDAGIKRVRKQIPCSGVDESHHKHMEEQAKK